MCLCRNFALKEEKMASTRNRNTASDYNNEQSLNHMNCRYNMYTGFGQHVQPALFRNGANPSRMYATNMVSNAVDVESMLRGIRASDLENGAFKVEPNFKELKEISYYDNKVPMVVPPSFFHIPFERPNFLG